MEESPADQLLLSQCLTEGWNSLHGCKRNRDRGDKKQKDTEIGRQGKKKNREKEVIHPAVNVITEGNLHALV